MAGINFEGELEKHFPGGDDAKTLSGIDKNNVGIVASKQVKVKFKELVRIKRFYVGLLGKYF